MPQNDFVAYATGGSAPVESQAAYVAEAPNGRGPGIFPKESFNKIARQGTSMAAAVGAFILSQGGSALDDGNTNELRDAIIAAINHLVGASPLAPIFGSVYNNDTSIRTLTLNLSLPVGTWTINADATAFSSAFAATTLTINGGTPVQSLPNFGDPDGASFVVMGGIKQVTNAGPGNLSVAITFAQEAGGTDFPLMIKAIALKS